MPMKFRCTACTARLHVPSRWAGTTIECPKCSTRVVVPARSTEAVENRFEDRDFEKRIATLEFPAAPCPPEAILDGEPDPRPAAGFGVGFVAALVAIAGLIGLATGFAAGFWCREWP